MKKLLFLFISFLIILSLFGCTNNVDGDNVYTNEEYGFKITLPIEWGKIQEDVNQGANGPVIVLSSKNNHLKYVSIGIIEIEKKNDPEMLPSPLIAVGSNEKYEFSFFSSEGCYVEAGCGDMKYKELTEEAKQILDSFELINE